MKGCRWSLSPFMICTGRARRFSNELGFNRDWVEKCLAHEEGHSSRGVYNKGECEQQRRHMLQECADIVDTWVEGRKRTPTLYPPSMHLIPAEPTT
jgi:hypothetical protein